MHCDVWKIKCAALCVDNGNKDLKGENGEEAMVNRVRYTQKKIRWKEIREHTLEKRS